MGQRAWWAAGVLLLGGLALGGCAAGRPTQAPPQRLTAQAEVFGADAWFGASPERHVVLALEAMPLDDVAVAGYLELAEHLTDAGADDASTRVLRRLQQRVALARRGAPDDAARWDAWVEDARWRVGTMRFARGRLARGLCHRAGVDRCVARVEGLLAAGAQEARRAWQAYETIVDAEETIGLQLLQAIEREQLDHARRLSWLLRRGGEQDRYLGELAVALHARGRVAERDAVLTRIWDEIGATPPAPHMDRWLRALGLEQTLRPEAPVFAQRAGEVSEALTSCAATRKACAMALGELCVGLSARASTDVAVLARACPAPDRAAWAGVDVLQSAYAASVRVAAQRGDMTRAIRLADELHQRGHPWRHLVDDLLNGCARHDKGWDALELLLLQVDDDAPRAELLVRLAHGALIKGHPERAEAITRTIDRLALTLPKIEDADAVARIRLAHLRAPRLSRGALSAAWRARMASIPVWQGMLRDASGASVAIQHRIAREAPRQRLDEPLGPVQRQLIDQLAATVQHPSASPELSSIAATIAATGDWALARALWPRLPSLRARDFFARRLAAEAGRRPISQQLDALRLLEDVAAPEARLVLLRHALAQPAPTPHPALAHALAWAQAPGNELAPGDRTQLIRLLLRSSAEHPADPIGAARLARTISAPFYRQVATQDIMEHLVLREAWGAPERALVAELLGEVERSTARGASRTAYREHAVALLVRDGQCARAARLTPRALEWTIAQLTTCARHDPALATRQALRITTPRTRAHALLMIMRHTSRATLTRALAAEAPARL